MNDNHIESNTVYDLVIVGAGLSGSLLALSLLKQNDSLKILLLDENSERTSGSESVHPSFDGRCIALNAGSIDILNELSLWENIQKNAQSISQIQVSDRSYFGSLELFPDIENDAFGYVVELTYIGQVLASALSNFPLLTTLYNVRLNNLIQQTSSVICELNNGLVITTKLCVGADGGGSRVREMAKIDSYSRDYQCSAIVCNVRTSQSHQSIAYERFTEKGPIALLPLTDDRFSLVYCIENNNVDEVRHLSDTDFLALLQQSFGFRAGVFKVAGKRDIYPLSLLASKQPIAHRVVCIGNAAHSLHPVAGQGFNLGLRDLFVLSKVIAKADKDNIGSFSMLKQYWAYREADHHKTILMTDSLVRIFSNQYHFLSIPRHIGLQAMSCFSFLSQPIIEQAKGQFDLFNRENLS
jgi:2-octaprenyl-6-methoxyphenol hydroxylase